MDEPGSAQLAQRVSPLLKNPDSRSHSSPVSSPLPLRRWQPAKSGCAMSSSAYTHAPKQHNHAYPHQASNTAVGTQIHALAYLWKDGRDTRSHGALAPHPSSLPFHQRHTRHSHAGHIADGVQGTRREPSPTTSDRDTATPASKHRAQPYMPTQMRIKMPSLMTKNTLSLPSVLSLPTIRIPTTTGTQGSSQAPGTGVQVYLGGFARQAHGHAPSDHQAYVCCSSGTSASKI